MEEKKKFTYTHCDRTKKGGSLTRGRVAYVLLAARSRKETVRKINGGYQVGSFRMVKR